MSLADPTLDWQPWDLSATNNSLSPSHPGADYCPRNPVEYLFPRLKTGTHRRDYHSDHRRNGSHRQRNPTVSITDPTL